jgi:hypothetical protein
VASATAMTPEQRHGIDPTHEWYPGDGCPVCAKRLIDRYTHLTRDERRLMAAHARRLGESEALIEGLFGDDRRFEGARARGSRWMEIADELYPDTMEVRP